MNSVQAIHGSLLAGLGSLIGTKLIQRDELASGELHFRPIVEPRLSCTLHICEMAGPPSTFALELVRKLVLGLIGEAVQWGMGGGNGA